MVALAGAESLQGSIGAIGSSLEIAIPNLDRAHLLQSSEAARQAKDAVIASSATTGNFGSAAQNASNLLARAGLTPEDLGITALSLHVKTPQGGFTARPGGSAATVQTAERGETEPSGREGTDVSEGAPKADKLEKVQEKLNVALREGASAEGANQPGFKRNKGTIYGANQEARPIEKSEGVASAGNALDLRGNPQEERPTQIESGARESDPTNTPDSDRMARAKMGTIISLLHEGRGVTSSLSAGTRGVVLEGLARRTGIGGGQLSEPHTIISLEKRPDSELVTA